VITFVLDRSLLLIAGTVAAVCWANVDFSSYDAVAHPLHFRVNDVGMVLLFRARREGGVRGDPSWWRALASGRQALSPLAAAVGGMVVPAAIYATLVATAGTASLMRGWAIPCATDIAFSAMVARVIFPAGHPAFLFCSCSRLPTMQSG
jgi:NhaA family Na+:H+ antiporter